MVSQGTSMISRPAYEVIESWPEDQRGVAQGVLDKYGEPDETTPTRLIWRQRGPWKEMIAYRESWHHEFPFPHDDCFESIAQYQVPVDKMADVARFDGSVTAWRTRGWISATCHDEQANHLAVNLAHDVATGAKSVDEARHAYVEAMIDYRAKKTVPYMERLQFETETAVGDTDVAVVTSEELREEARQRH